MEIQQLELDLWQSLETAVKFPQTADFTELCDALDFVIAPHSTREQLILVAEAINQLCQVYAARVELVFFDWQRRYNPTEPVVALEECVGLFVQSLHLDVADLFEPPDSVQYPANRQPRTQVDLHDSLVGQVDKAVLLAVVDQLSADHLLTEAEFAEQLRQLADEEDFEKSQQAIALWMQQCSGKTVSLMQLQQALEEIVAAVSTGDKVTLVGFGSFEQRSRQAREGRNPQTGEKMQIAATRVPAFAPGKLFKQRVASE